jgi:phosphonoacetate hydrolase
VTPEARVSTAWFPSRRDFLRSGGLLSAAALSVAARSAAAAESASQRICVVLLDGFGVDYFEQTPMPVIKSWARDGFHKSIRGVMPSVTNTNIAGLCCGVFADEHGITANSYWDVASDRELFMSDGNLLTAATLFQRAARFGVRSALISAKQKTIPLLRQGTALAIGSQQPPPEIVKRHGAAPDVYSPDVNYWVWRVAIDVIKNQPGIGLLFVHTTDYPMHMFPPGDSESQAHLRTIDGLLAEAAAADPRMAFFVTADHGMNFKTGVINLEKALLARGVAVRFVMSAERDQYPRHHSGFGGTAFVYLNSPGDAEKVIPALRQIDGVEEVLSRSEAAKRYRLNPHRLGDIWVTAQKDVVFGHSAQEREGLPKKYRSHGSAYELDVPCVIYRYAGALPDRAAVTTNVDVCKFLYARRPTG